MGSLLGDDTYLRYWLAVVISFGGDAMVRITLIWVAATLTDAPVLLIALVVIAQLLPAGVFGAFLGPVVDLVPTRVLLVGSDLFRLLVVLAMLPALRTPWLMLVLIMLEGTGRACFEVARIAAIPRIVGEHSIAAAVALFQSTSHTVNLVGPAVGGALLAASGPRTVLVVDAATFLVSAMLLGSLGVLRRNAQPADRPEPYRQALRSGLRGVLAVPSLRFLAVFLVPATIVLGWFTASFNAQLLTVFALSPDRYGLAQGMFGAGAVLAALAGPVLVRRYTPTVLLAGSLALFGVGLVAIVPARWLWQQAGLPPVLAWCVLVGAGSGSFLVPVANTLLKELPARLRGRGVGLLNALTTNLTVLGVVFGAVTAELFGAATAIVGAGVVLLASAASAFVRLRHSTYLSNPAVPA